jgi:hypothetical protein
MQHAFKGRGRKAPQPLLLQRRQAFDRFLDLRIEIATEPGLGAVESDCLKRSERGIVYLNPCLPENVIFGVSVKKDSQLVNVMEDRIPKENIPKYMKSEITEVVDGRKRSEGKTVDSARDAPFPKTLDSSYMEIRYGLIPEAEV